MKKLFILTILLVINFKQNVFAQFDPNVDYENYSIGSSANKFYLEQYQNNDQKSIDIQPKPTDNYQNNIPKANNNYQNIYNNQINNNFAIPKSKTLYNFSDGLGEGYRVYDNSNRQSYFCGLSSNKKNLFTHQNNFNGVYVGIGVNFVNSSIDISQNYRYTSINQSNNPVKPTSYNASSNSTVPSIIIGQGRLFSNGLFLGQEMSILVGDFTLDKKNLKPQSLASEADAIVDQIKFRASNLSYYSGKFGFNIFDVVLPYVKVGLSFSSTNFQLKFKDGSTKNSTGGWPFLTYGAGFDISVFENFRFMIDYTMLSSSAEVYFYQYYSSESGSGVDKSFQLPIDLTSSFMRANLVYRF
jgi:hypothetical protein